MGNSGSQSEGPNDTRSSRFTIRRAPTLTSKKLTKLANRTQYSRLEVIDWYNLFIERFPSGYVSRADFESYFKIGYENSDPTRYVKLYFNAAGVKPFGKMGFGKFLTCMSDETGDPLDQLKWAFTIFDISKSDAVTKSDMRKVLRAFYELVGKPLTDENDSPATRTDRVFDAIDTFNLGYLDYADFVEGVRTAEWILETLLLNIPKRRPIPRDIPSRRYFSSWF